MVAFCPIHQDGTCSSQGSQRYQASEITSVDRWGPTCICQSWLFQTVPSHQQSLSQATTKTCSPEGRGWQLLDSNWRNCCLCALCGNERRNGPQLDPPSLPPPGVPFDIDELQHALEKIPATKAVPKCFPSGPLWKSQAHFIAHWLYPRLESWWSHSPPVIPQAWEDAWACWLPKPHKPATKLENLRMLGLQEPVGKTVLQLITSKALTACFPTLCKWPQMAYLPYRSTRDALLRAA